MDIDPDGESFLPFQHARGTITVGSGYRADGPGADAAERLCLPQVDQPNSVFPLHHDVVR